MEIDKLNLNHIWTGKRPRIEITLLTKWGTLHCQIPRFIKLQEFSNYLVLNGVRIDKATTTTNHGMVI